MDLLTYEEFCEELNFEISQLLEDDEKLEEGEVTKLNGLKLDALMIHKRGEEIVPTMYYNYLYEMYADGYKIAEITEYAYSFMHKGYEKCSVDFKDFTEFENVREHICFKLVNAISNDQYLKDVPHIKLLDLALVFSIFIENEDGTYQSVIPETLMKIWDIDEEQLIEIAKENTLRIIPPDLSDYEEFVKEHPVFSMPESGKMPKLYICGSKTGKNGAVYMFDKEMLGKAADEFENDVLIIPSSIHEVFLIPEGTIGREELDEMIKCVNETALEEGEYLSDHSYIYRREKKIIEM